MIEMIPLPEDHPEYQKRIQFLLDRMKHENWKAEPVNDKPKTPRGRKPAPSKKIVNMDPGKPRNNKFFRY